MSSENVLERMARIDAKRKIADFMVKEKQPYSFKVKYAAIQARKFVGDSVPYLDLMASEGGRRAKSLRINGCNYFGKSTIRSAPFAIFNRNDLLQLALELNVPVSEIERGDCL